MDCKCCCRFRDRLESVSAVVSGGALTVTIIPPQAFIDYKYYELDLCVALPERTGIEPVAISDGANSYPVIDTNGQPVVSGKLRGHKRYRVRYGAGGTLSVGTMPPHFTVCDGLCRMEYSANAALQSQAATMKGDV